MKRITILILIFAFLVGCKNGENTKGDNPKISNLLDEKSKQEIKELGEKSLPAENIKKFLGQVNYYNETIDTQSLVQEGYEKFENGKRAYDLDKITTSWTEKNPVFTGFNCRITTYTLLKDTISINKTSEPDTSLLFIDKDALELADQETYKFDQKSIEEIETLFGAVPTKLGKTKEEYIKDIQNYWNAQGVKFNAKDTSMISVWFLDDIDEKNPKLFVGHVGVLLKDKDSYKFIEKISFEDPYQVLSFSNKEQLKNYLENYYNRGEGQLKPIIIENNSEL